MIFWIFHIFKFNTYNVVKINQRPEFYAKLYQVTKFIIFFISRIMFL